MQFFPKKTNPYLKKGGKTLYEKYNKRFIVDELSMGKLDIEYSYIESKGGVCIIAMDENGQVPMVGQWRYPLEATSWEFPAGGCEENEIVLETAKRELLEEAGVEAEEWIYLGYVHPNASHCRMKSHAYLARGLKIGEPKPDPNEDLDIQWAHWDEIVQAAHKGQITEALSIFAIFRAQEYLRNEE